MLVFACLCVLVCLVVVAVCCVLPAVEYAGAANFFRTGTLPPHLTSLNLATLSNINSIPVFAVVVCFLTTATQVIHTLTGHGDAVSCVCCSPLHETTAVSTGEDRCIKVIMRQMGMVGSECFHDECTNKNNSC